MRSPIALVVALFALSSMTDAQNRPVPQPQNYGKVICYYNSTSFIREGEFTTNFQFYFYRNYYRSLYSFALLGPLRCFILFDV